MFIITDKVKGRRGREEVEGVGVMKDEELKLAEIEASHTLGRAGEVVLQVEVILFFILPKTESRPP